MFNEPGAMTDGDYDVLRAEFGEVEGFCKSDFGLMPVEAMACARPVTR